MNLRSLTARDLMNTEVVTIAENATLAEATRLMHETKLRCLIVPASRRGGAPGILTTKDVLCVMDEDDTVVFEDVRVAEVMTQPAVCVQQGLSIHDCIRLMRMTGVRRLPVQREDQTVGLVSYSDIFHHVAGQI